MRKELREGRCEEREVQRYEAKKERRKESNNSR